MGSSREQVATCVLSKCQALYELPHAKSDPAYQAMCEIYIEQLRPFDAWELQEGMSVLIQRRRTRKWPSIGEISEACGEVRRERRPPDKRNQRALPAKPERVPDPPEIRERLKFKCIVRAEWQANGKYTAKDEHGNWRYGIADLNREAEARMKRQST